LIMWTDEFKLKQEIAYLRALVKVKDEVLEKFADRKAWCGYELLQWDKEEHPAEVAKSVIGFE
jgi:hypothetical protein